MKFNTMVRSTLATAMSLAMAFGLSACSRDYTSAYVYSASSSNGTISAFAVDYQSGVLTQISGSPFASQLSNPSTLVPAPNGKFIYVIGGTQNSQVEEFAVGTDGKLYGQNTYNITGSYPTAAAIDSTGSFLYVTFTYQIGFTPAGPGPGGITIFPIKSDNSLGTPVTVNGLNYVPVGNNPVGIAVSTPYCSSTPIIAGNTSCSTGHDNVFVYVIDQEPSPNATVLGFAQNTSTGALQLLSGTTYNTTLKTYQGAHAGVTPSGIAIDPTTRYVYVTDKTSNQVLGYQIASGTSGNLTALVSSPYTTGLYPVSLTIDPRGKYLYTANYNSNTVSGFTLNEADGSLGGTAASNFSTATGPTCVTIEPALGIYLYTSNYLDNSISGGQLNPNTGALTAIANTPFNAGPLPSCVTSVPNGDHAQSIVNP
jgi:6-phosphogluconolactonase (cycloisomerase 2 family)